eukprot:UN28685
MPTFNPDVIVLQDYSLVPGGYYVSKKYNRANSIKHLKKHYASAMKNGKIRNLKEE